MISKRLGTRLFTTYLLIKVLYLINAIGQIFMMQKFLGFNKGNYTLFGFAVAQNILSGKDWEVTLIFARVGFCAVPLRHLMRHVRSTAQCVLPVNMLNERIYVFLWFWILLAAILTAVSIPIWFFRMAYQKSRTRFVKRFLKAGEHLSREDKYMVKKFTREFLRHDGIFLLRMIALNAGDIICTDIVHQLWLIYKQRYYNQDLNDCGGDRVIQNHGSVRLENGSKEKVLLHRPVMASAPPFLISGDSSDWEKEDMRKEYL